MATLRWQANRVATAAVAVLVAVVLSAGLVAAAAVDESPAPEEYIAAGKLGLSQVGLAEQGEAEAKPPATTAPPSTATTAAPSRTTTPATADSKVAPPLPGHRTPGAVVAPFKAGRTEWSGVSNGITLRMVMSPAAPRAGERVTFTVEASTPSGLCCGLMLMTGDGGGDQYPPPPALDDHRGCSAQEPKSNSVKGEMHHIYNKAGRWNFSFSARTGGICTATESGYGSLDGTLEIGGGSAAPTAQGPAQPTVRPASIYPYAPRVITFSAEAQDDDGYIDRFIVEWGDGSATETFRNPQPCKQGLSGWPGGTYTILPHWMGVPSVTHRYGDDKPHTVTVTVVSTGCDRSAEQRVSGTIVFPEPLPPPPPIESIPWPSTSGFPPPPPISSLPVPPPGSVPFPPMPPPSVPPTP